MIYENNFYSKQLKIITIVIGLLSCCYPLFSQNPSDIWSSDNLLKRLEKENLTGIFLFNPQTNLNDFFSFCKKSNINIIFSNESLYTNQSFLKRAKSEGVAISLNFPVYFNEEYLKQRPDHYAITSDGEKAIEGWLHFACPSAPGFTAYQDEQLMKLIELTNPAMVSLDFIRFFVFWETVYPETNHSQIIDGCYCSRCIDSFQDFSGINVQSKTATWIKANALSEWTKWKCHIIEERVRVLSDIIKSYNIPVALKLVPWRETDFNGAIRSVAGQDVNRLKNYVDIFIPMTYSHMIKRKPEWISEMASHVHETTNKPILNCIEVRETYVEEPIPDQEFSAMLDYGVMQPSDGIILFHYDYFNLPRKDLLFEWLSK